MVLFMWFVVAFLAGACVAMWWAVAFIKANS